MEKRKFNSLPKGIKCLIFLIGLVISFLIALVIDRFRFDNIDEFIFPFIISFIVFCIIAFFVGAGSYEGFKNLKEWIKKAIFGGGLLISTIFGLIIEGFVFDFDEYFLIPFFLFYIGIFVVSSVIMWIYDSYKNQ